jgi:hypothetical protein
MRAVAGTLALLGSGHAGIAAAIREHEAAIVLAALPFYCRLEHGDDLGCGTIA